MSYFEQFMQANQAYVALHGQLNLPLKPKTRVAIVTCMDSRLHVAQALGLALGDAHILRNAGGRVTEDMIRSLVISQQQMGTREIVVLHHTDCGAHSLDHLHSARYEHPQVPSPELAQRANVSPYRSQWQLWFWV